MSTLVYLGRESYIHDHHFLCRAICPELVAETIALREVIQARTHRRKVLRHTLQDRARTIATLLEAHRGSRAVDELPMIVEPDTALEKDRTREDIPKLKRYCNE